MKPALAADQAPVSGSGAPAAAAAEPGATPRAAAAGFPDPDSSYYAVPYEALPSEVKRARAAAGFPGPGMEFKAAPTEIKADAGKRQVEIWIAAYGNVDAGGDIISHGAAAKSIKRDGPGGKRRIKFFVEHSTLLGPALVVEEHQKGIFMVGQVDDHPDLTRYLEHAKSGALAEGSIGYTVVDSRTVKVAGGVARELSEIKLWEGSMVCWGMNEQTSIEAVKSARAAGIGRKDLFDFAEVIRCQAMIESCLQTIEWLTTAEWAKLTEEQRAEVVRLLELMVGGEKALRASLATKQALLPLTFTTPPTTPAAVPDTTKYDAAVLDSLSRLHATLRGSLGGN